MRRREEEEEDDEEEEEGFASNNLRISVQLHSTHDIPGPHVSFFDLRYIL